MFGVGCPTDSKLVPAIISTAVIVVLLSLVIVLAAVLRGRRGLMVTLLCFVLLVVGSLCGVLYTYTAGGFAIAFP